MKRVVLVGLVLVVGIAIGLGSSDDTVQTVNQNRTVQTQPFAPIENIAADWSSDEAYVYEMSGDTTDYADLLDIIADAFGSYQDGMFTDSEMVYLLELSIDTINTYRDKYRGTVAPKDYQESHQLALKAWDLQVEGLEYAILGFELGDMSYIEKATRTFQQSTALINQGTDLLNDLAASR